MCSHPRTGDATAERIAEENHEKLNELKFLRQNHGLCQNKKIASPSQAKNRSCSCGFKVV